MDDSCAVCADNLEWVAYGSCGHREVCSTCVVRMRFVLNDRRCCLCKIESSTVFVTKALGDYTRVITDFSQFPEGIQEGQTGNYWYHEDTQAYFDDVDHYRMIKAMCRLSCSVCDRNGEDVEGGGGGWGKRRSRFKNIEQLKSHLYHRHRLFMCTLCLEGRKVFICEQKLYTRAQLNKHISSGDPEVDGSDTERGGFMGHPMCEFCKSPFYGDNELYTHMSTEHYTCHICQRQHPGQYDYFRNYDDLEIHFRQEHHLCENEACLAKKFIVFQSESELKRHNAIEHGGNMSRSKRNAALQIPTSFRYRRSEHEQRRGRGRGFRNESSDNQLVMAIHASLETANVDSTAHGSFTSGQADFGLPLSSQVDVVTGQLESLAVSQDSGPPSRSPLRGSQSSRNAPAIDESSFPPLSDREPPETFSRYAQALTQGSSSSTRLGEEAFPPLPGSSEMGQPKPSQLGEKTIAAHLRQQSKMVHNSAQAKPAGHPGLQSFTSVSSPQLWPTLNQEFGQSTSASSSQTRTKANQIVLSSSSSSSQVKTAREDEFGLPRTANSAWGLSSTKRLSHSTSAPSLIDSGSSHPPSSHATASAGSNGTHRREQSLQSAEDVHTANNTLIDKIRSGLAMDEDKYAAFKNVSAEFRQGLINTFEYLSYVEQFHLLHLVPELARLCPDVQKQKELIDTYTANWHSKDKQETSASSTVKQKKGKGKSVEPMEDSRSQDALADSILSTVKKLQANYKPEEEVEVLSKGGYRSSKGKSVSAVNEERSNLSSVILKSDKSATISDQTDAGGSKQRPKKTTKFHRMRLGDGSMGAILDPNHSNVNPECTDETDSGNSGSEGLPVRGVWKNGGGHRLISTSKGPSK